MNICIHCANHKLDGMLHLCTNPDAERVDRVTGLRAFRETSDPLQCYEARQERWPCGVEGVLWRQA